MDSLHLSIHKEHKPFNTELFIKNIKEGQTVLDLGANIGYTTLTFARLVGETGRVYAFEPDPENFKILEKNIKENNFKNVVLINKAISNKDGKIKFYIRKDNTAGNGMSNLTFSSMADKKEIEVESITLNNYFKNNQKIDFIKIDIQGAEYLALIKMTTLLKNSVKMFIRYTPILLTDLNKRIGVGKKEFFKFLTDLNFEIYEIDEKIKKLKLTSYEQLKDREDYQYIDLFLIKESKNID